MVNVDHVDTVHGSTKGVDLMALIADDVKKRVSQRLSGMSEPVEAVVYSDGSEEAQVLLALMREVAALNDHIRVTEAAGAAGELLPALGFKDKTGQDFGVLFRGLPNGYEFAVLLDDLVQMSTGQTQLSPETRAQLQSITKPTLIKVFTTPT
jgi:alkyl hydroperoxide reductase subunit AhpF